MMKSSDFAETVRAMDSRVREADPSESRTGAESVEQCEFIEGALNDYLARQCADKVNSLNPCEGDIHDGCSCASGAGGAVDLVMLIDSSGSMRSKAKAVNDAASAALDMAQERCGTKASVTWLWVDGSKSGSSPGHHLGADAGRFAQSHQEYLEGLGATGPFYHDVADPGGSHPREQGADAIADISEFFDWRPGACRSIFYISDTTLEGVRSDEAANDAAKTQAISVATLRNVTIFAHLAADVQLTGGMSLSQVEADYHELCTATGGAAETNSAPSAALYEELIVRAICECADGCSAVDIPAMEPCISVSWGDSECDGMETDDTETVCITVCNCYTNVAFNNLTVGYVWVLDEDGTNVAVLPDGTPSVEAIPHGPICFGDIGPCVDDEPTCVTREFVVQTRGAKEGKYRLLIGSVCYEVSHHFDIDACFELVLCKS